VRWRKRSGTAYVFEASRFPLVRDTRQQRPHKDSPNPTVSDGQVPTSLVEWTPAAVIGCLPSNSFVIRSSPDYNCSVGSLSSEGGEWRWKSTVGYTVGGISCLLLERGASDEKVVERRVSGVRGVSSRQNALA